MATVCALVCWGGRTGKTVTFTDAGDIVNSTNHGLPDGFKIVFSTTGTLPVGITSGITYYTKLGTDNNKFTLWTDGTLTTQVTFTGTGTGTHNAKSDLIVNPSIRLAPYGLSNLSRWGAYGEELIYDGVGTAQAALAAFVDENDVVKVEIGEAFKSIVTYGFNVSLLSPDFTISTHINGIRSEGFHFGVVGAGFIFWQEISYSNGIRPLGSGVTIDGVSFFTSLNNNYAMQIGGTTTVINCIAYATGSPANTFGFYITSGTTQAIFINNLALGFDGTNGRGISFDGYNAPYLYFAHNQAHKNSVGIRMNTVTANQDGWYYNNISFGNTINWSTYNNESFNAAKNNCGGAGDSPWFKGVDTSITTLTTADFADWVNNDFRPASALSVQVDSALAGFRTTKTDIADKERPNYNSGSAEIYDCGCYEFDRGIARPASHTLTLTNVVVGSRVHIRDQADTVTHYDDIASASSVVIPITVYGDSRDNWRIKVRKASSGTTYIPYETLMTATAGSSSIYVSQIPDE